MYNKKYCNTECCNSIRRVVEYILLKLSPPQDKAQAESKTYRVKAQGNLKHTRCGLGVPETSGSSGSVWKCVKRVAGFGHKYFCLELCQQNWSECNNLSETCWIHKISYKFPNYGIQKEPFSSQTILEFVGSFRACLAGILWSKYHKTPM